MKARNFRASQVSAFANSKQAKTTISNMRNVIIKGNQLDSLANISSKRDMFIKDNKQVMFINTYAIHTCCRLAGHLEEGMVMGTSTTTLV